MADRERGGLGPCHVVTDGVGFGVGAGTAGATMYPNRRGPGGPARRAQV